MGIFSNVLLTSDFDRTLTAPDSTIPAANLAAIRYFIQQGGAFTLNTGRSLPMSRPCLKRVQVNAPLLLYNGAVAYDTRQETAVFTHSINLEPQELVGRLEQRFPDLLLEVQGLEAHYVFDHAPLWLDFGRKNSCRNLETTLEALPGPFLKVALYGQFRDDTVAQFYDITPEQDAYFCQVEKWLAQTYGNRISVARGAPRILDIQAAGTSKGEAARELACRMGRGTLVCVGDGTNDETMLAAADLAFVAADGARELTARYPTAAPCGSGTVADVVSRLAEIFGSGKNFLVF